MLPRWRRGERTYAGEDLCRIPSRLLDHRHVSMPCPAPHPRGQRATPACSEEERRSEMNPPTRLGPASLGAAFPFVLDTFESLRSLLVRARELERTWSDLFKQVFQEGETR